MRVVPVEREPVPVDPIRLDPIRLDPIRLDTIPLDTVLDAVRALQRGLPVLVVDDEDRENEGDVIIAAEHATAEWVAWAVRHGSGLLCAPMPAGWADRLRLPPMVVDNQDPRRTDYTVSVDAASGVGTGISAADRARTVRVLADPESGPQDVIRPGHVFPLRARPGGVLERSGHTEAAVDLCRLAGLSPVGLITEVVEDDGTLMRLPALRRLADSRDLPLISIEDLVAHRRELGEERSEHRVERVAVTRLPTRFGTFEAHGYRDRHTAAEHVVLLASSPAVSEPASDPVSEPVSPPVSQPESRVPLVRVHSECLTGDTLGSLRCDCGPQLETSLREVAAAGGAVVYLGGHEGRGIGLLAKLAAYQLQDDGQDTVSANLSQGLPVDAREYGAAAAILHDLGLTRIALLTNNPAKVEALVERGIEVVSRIPLVVGESEHNRSYLRTKRQLMGHQL